MALSSWDTLAVNLNGEAQAGFFVSPGGVKIEIYKNWIYIRDPKAWREGGSFTQDVVMEIQHGELRYGDVEIHAIRGPQNGVYVVCWHENEQTTGMIGCGVYGYEGEKWIGVTPDSVEFLQKWISHKERMFSDEEIDDIVANWANPKADAGEWALENREEFIFDFSKEIAGVKLDQAIRYNQGNMYFAKKVGTPLDETKPGESSDKPTIMKLLKPSQ